MQGKIRGFTLIELMITLAVLAVLTAIAAPSFTNFMLNQKIKTASFDLITGLSLARSEAIKTNGSVSIQAQDDDWAKGWIIVKDPGGADETTLKTMPAFERIAISTDPETTSITYGRSGRVTAGAGSFEIDDDESNSAVRARCITIGTTGLPRSKEGSCS